MRLFIFIIILLSIVVVLESQAVIPESPYSLLGAVSAAGEFIKSLNIHSYYLIIPDITITLEGILTTLLTLFVIGFILERFKTLEQNNYVLTKQLQRLSQKISDMNKDLNRNNETTDSKEDEMQGIAKEIRDFLSTLAQSVTNNHTTPVRSKKIRRVSAESSIGKDESEEVASVPETINDQTNSLVESPAILDSEPSEIQKSHKTDEQINNDDDNLSNIDLARALIESGEREKAKEIILNIIKTGSADQAHEARILNLQIS